MINYLQGCLIAFIILLAIIRLFKKQLLRWAEPNAKQNAMYFLLLLSLIPILREGIVLILVFMAFCSDEKVDDTKKRAQLKQEDNPK